MTDYTKTVVTPEGTQVVEMTDEEKAIHDADQLKFNQEKDLKKWERDMAATDGVLLRVVEDIIDWAIVEGWDINNLNTSVKENYDNKKVKRGEKP